MMLIGAQITLILGLAWLIISCFSINPKDRVNTVQWAYVLSILVLLSNWLPIQPFEWIIAHSPKTIETVQLQIDLPEKSVTSPLNTPLVLNETASVKPHEKKPINFNISGTLLFIWLFGTALLIVSRIKQMSTILYEIKASKQETLQPKGTLVWSNTAQVPFLFVLKSAFIVMPRVYKNSPQEMIELIVAHELTHFERKDHWRLFFAQMFQSIFWFHPLVHLLNHQYQIAIEACCDTKLVDSGVDPIFYAETLMACTGKTQPSPVTLAMSSKQYPLNNRIKTVLDHKQQRRKKNSVTVAAFCTLSAVACVEIDRTEWITSEHMVELVTHDIKPLTDNVMQAGELHVSALYDGVVNEKTQIQLELKNADGQASLLAIPLNEKFNKHIFTAQFQLKEGVQLTGKYHVLGVEPDGVVDGVALGLILADKSGEIKFHKTKTTINQGDTPNIICAWPLGISEVEFIAALPQVKQNNPDSVERMLCGAQLVSNGSYIF